MKTKRIIKVCIGIVAIITLLISSFLYLTNQEEINRILIEGTGIGEITSKTWYDTDYGIKLNVTVEEVGGTILTNYTIFMNLSHQTGMATDFTDLLFVMDNNTELPHWVDTKTDSVNAYVWVMMPNMTISGNKTVELYYNRTGGSDVQNPNGTFMYYNEFSTDVVDLDATDDWECGSSVCNVTNGFINVRATAAAYEMAMYKAQNATNASIITRVRAISSAASALDFMTRKNGLNADIGATGDYYMTYHQGNVNMEIYENYGGFNSIAQSSGEKGNALDFQVYTLYVHDNIHNQTRHPDSATVGAYHPEINYSFQGTDSAGLTGYFAFSSHNTDKTLLGDYLIIRNYQDPEPVVYLGAAEGGSPPGPDPDTDPTTTLSAPANDTLIYNSTQYFAATFADTHNLTNTTFHIWNSTNDLVNATYIEITGTSNSTNLTFEIPAQGIFKWNYLTYDNSSNSDWGDDNFTIEYSNVTISSETLIGRYDFETCTGSTAVDTSGYGNNGTINGATWNNTDPKVGACMLSFDGINDYVEIPDSSLWDTYSMSVCSWVYLTETGATQSVVDRGHSGVTTDGWELEVWRSGGKTGFGMNHGNGVTEAYAFNNSLADEPTNGTWQLLCSTYNFTSGQVLIYQNGLRIPTLGIDGNNSNQVDNAKKVMIGRRSDSSDQWLNGSLDQVLIYNSTLTADEILNLYTVGLTGPPTADDAPEVTLTGPADATITYNATSFFAGSFVDDFGLSSSTLNIWNSGGGTENTSVFTISGITNSSNISVVLSDFGTYEWNYLVEDNSSNQAWASSNFTITYANTSFVSTEGLIGRYDFETCSGGIAYDTSGYGNNGTIDGAIWNSTDAKVDSCMLTFDGTNDFVRIPDAVMFDTYFLSVCAWVRADETGTDQSPVDRGHYGANNNGWQLELYNDGGSTGLGMNHADGSPPEAYADNNTMAPSTTDGNWQHLCGTYNYTTGEVILYRNGTRVPTPLIANNATVNVDNSKDVMFGRRYDSADQWLNGSMDQVLIYNRTLAASEVNNLYLGYVLAGPEEEPTTALIGAVLTYDTFSDGLINNTLWLNTTTQSAYSTNTELASTYIEARSSSPPEGVTTLANISSNFFFNETDIKDFINNMTVSTYLQALQGSGGSGEYYSIYRMFGADLLKLSCGGGSCTQSDTTIWTYIYDEDDENFDYYNDGVLQGSLGIADTNATISSHAKSISDSGSGTARINYWNYTMRRSSISTLVVPVDDGFSNDDNVFFNTSMRTPVSGKDRFALQNSTFFIWNSTDDLVNFSTNALSGTDDTTFWQMGGFEIGTYEWNVLTCTNYDCVFATNNNTMSFGFETTNSTYNASVLETTTQTYSMNITTPDGVSVQSAILSYNGTNYTNADKSNPNGNVWVLSRTISVPSGEEGFVAENRTFNWVVTLSDDDAGTTSNLETASETQEVTELTFGLCGGALTVPMINFTMFDESTGTQIDGTANATTFQATFTLGASPDSIIKNYSINNQSVNSSEFDFCTGAAANIIYADMNAYYTAVDYTDKNYYLSGATLTNVTNEVSLFLLPDALGVQFFVTVLQDLVPLEAAQVQVAKYFPGEGLYKTIEIENTDVDGKFTAYLELDKQHRFTVIKDSELLGVFDRTSSCEAAPCEITLSIAGDQVNPYTGFGESFASDVLYNLTYDPITQIVTFDFVDTTGLATSFKMDVVKRTSNSSEQPIFTNRVYTSSGSMTYNASGLDDGEYTVNTYIARSPDVFITYLTILISTFGVTLGLTGLFVGLLFLLVIIFGLALSPAMLVFAVPLGLTTLKLAGFLMISAPILLMFYVTAIVVAAALKR